MSDNVVSSLKEQGKAVLIMVGVAIMSILGMIILGLFGTSVPNATAAINTTIAAFIAGFALVGTFATITMLVIVVKAIIGVVRGLK